MRFASASPRRKSTSLEPEPVRPPSSNTSTSAEVLNGLVSALQDPETFEAAASSIFATHNVEPSVASALMQLVKQKPKQRSTKNSRPVERYVERISSGRNNSEA